VKRTPHLLREEEVIAQGLTAVLPPAQLALVDDMAAWLRPVGVRRGTRVRDRSAQLREGAYEAKGPCHSRARCCGEPRGTAGARPAADQDSNTTPAQVSVATAAKKTKLPKLRARVRFSSSPAPLKPQASGLGFVVVQSHLRAVALCVP
jgi:hypothetical protein